MIALLIYPKGENMNTIKKLNRLISKMECNKKCYNTKEKQIIDELPSRLISCNNNIEC